MKFIPMILANLARKKLRTILTIGSFTTALFLFTFLASLKSAFNRGTDIASANRLVITNRISLIQPLPFAYRDQIAKLPGVLAVTNYNWFGGIYKDPRNFFPQYAIDAENQRKVVPELVVSGDQWQQFLNDRQGAIAGARLASRFGWKIGDRIPIMNSSFGGDSAWDFNLDGIYHSDKADGNEGILWFHRDYFEARVPEQFRGKVGWFVVRVSDPSDAVQVAKSIDNLFSNSAFETKTQTESAFATSVVKQFGNIEFLILAIGSVVFFTLVLVAGNTMAIAVRERIGELAILKALGFTDRAVLWMTLGESITISVLGGGIGLLGAALVIPAVNAGIRGALPPLVFSSLFVFGGMCLATAVGIIGGLLPALSAMRLRVVSALRGI